MQNKKIPMRMCCGCNQMKPKGELVRVVKDKEGNISVDFIGKQNGRGAYICKSQDCLSKAIKTKRIERCLDIQIPDDIYQRLREEF